MLGYGDAELAAFIFHELAHQAAYAPGDSDFNEAFAMVVEAEGLRRWFAREGSRRRAREVHRRAQAAARRRGAHGGRRGAGSPASTPAHPTPPPRATQKAAEFARLAEALAAGGHPATGELNNARLVAVATYERCVPALRAELERLGNDLPAFYAEMKRLENNRNARARLCPPT